MRFSLKVMELKEVKHSQRTSFESKEKRIFVHKAEDFKRVLKVFGMNVIMPTRDFLAGNMFTFPKGAISSTADQEDSRVLPRIELVVRMLYMSTCTPLDFTL